MELRRAVLERCFRIDQRVQGFVVDDHQLGCILGPVPVVCDHDRDRFAGPVHAVDGKDLGSVGQNLDPQPLIQLVRRLDRQPGEGFHPALEILAGEDGDHSGRGARGLYIHGDIRVRERAADHHRLNHARQRDVGHEPPMTT
jgi:hypothetical protein